jgi:carboxyl-terminal processing protease
VLKRQILLVPLVLLICFACAQKQPVTRPIMSPEQFEQFKTRMNDDKRGGFGVSLRRGDAPPRIVTIQPRSAACEADVRPGDEILEIDGLPTDEMSTQMVADRLAGPSGSPLTLKLQRPGENRSWNLETTRSRPFLDAVESAMLRDRVAYLRIHHFVENIVELVRRDFDAFGGKAINALIIDLRDNSGGLIEEAVNTADLFLKPGEPIGSLSNNGDLLVTWRAMRPQRSGEWKVALLVNDRTGAAAELFAAALSRSGTTVGTPTARTGRVKSYSRSTTGSVLETTVGYLRRADGRSIARNGVEIDRRVSDAAGSSCRKMAGATLEAALDILSTARD